MAEGPNRFAAVYIRVSTDEQAELSPESQLEKIREYAHREGIVVLRDHIYLDAGISGKKAEKRPEFMRMIAAAKEKGCPFTVVLVWKFSRFARNQEESIFYKSVLRSKCGVEVVSISEPLIAGHFGSLIERIIEWMDEFYSIRLSEEVKRSMEINARRGKLQSAPAFGYCVRDGRLSEIPEEAELVRWIFQAFVNGKGLYPIARELNAMGVCTHRGNKFENRTVEYILRNPVYIGKLRWNPAGKTRRDFFNENLILADGEHEPLIEQTLWNAAQRRLDDIKCRQHRNARPATELKHWLSGLIRCSICGTALIFSQPHYFKCGGYTKGRCASSQHVRADVLEAALTGQLRTDTASCPPLACCEICAVPDSGAEISRLENTLRDLERRKERLRRAYLAGVIELTEFTAERENTDKSVGELSEKITSLRKMSDTPQAHLSAVVKVSETFCPPDAAQEAKNSAARGILASCVFDKQAAALTVIYRVNL